MKEYDELKITQRDLQYLVAVTATFHVMRAAALGQAPREYFEHNIQGLEELFVREYSWGEANALAKQLRDLLPSDSPLEVTKVNTIPVLSHTSFVQ